MQISANYDSKMIKILKINLRSILILSEKSYRASRLRIDHFVKCNTHINDALIS
jgi:hypothetical protein